MSKEHRSFNRTVVQDTIRRLPNDCVIAGTLWKRPGGSFEWIVWFTYLTPSGAEGAPLEEHTASANAGQCEGEESEARKRFGYDFNRLLCGVTWLREGRWPDARELVFESRK